MVNAACLQGYNKIAVFSSCCPNMNWDFFPPLFTVLCLIPLYFSFWPEVPFILRLTFGKSQLEAEVNSWSLSSLLSLLCHPLESCNTEYFAHWYADSHSRYQKMLIFPSVGPDCPSLWQCFKAREGGSTIPRWCWWADFGPGSSAFPESRWMFGSDVNWVLCTHLLSLSSTSPPGALLNQSNSSNF